MWDTNAVVEIEQLVHRYGHVIDTRAWDELGDIFDEDIVLDASALGAPVQEGIAAVRASFESGVYPPSHYALNVWVRNIDGDTASVWSKGLTPQRAGGFGGLLYQDTVVRTGDGWRFTMRRIGREWLMTMDADTQVPSERA